MTRMRALTLAGLSTWLVVTPCRASPLTLDQSFVPPHVEHGLVIQNTQTVAQVFTVGRSGSLAAVDLLIGCCRFGPPAHDLVVEIRSTIGGVPTDIVLATVSVPSQGLAVDSLAFERVHLRGQHLPVRPGDVLSLVLSAVDPVLPGGGINPYAWGGEGFGGYAGGLTYVERGTGFLPTSWDMGFRTYVIPEPPALAALGLLFACALHRRRRSQGEAERSASRLATRAGRVLVVLVMAWCAGRPAAAAPIDCPWYGTLGDFMSLGSEPCGQGRAAYSDFTYAVIPTGGALDVPPESVRVEPGSTRDADVVAFVGDWRVAPGQSIDIRVGFSFEPVRLSGIGGASLQTDSASPVLTGALCLGGASPCDPDRLYALSATGGYGTFTFPAGRTGGRVELAFRLVNSPDNGDGQTAAVTAVHSALEVAEPGMLPLLAFGLGLGRWRRHRSRVT